MFVASIPPKPTMGFLRWCRISSTHSRGVDQGSLEFPKSRVDELAGGCH